MSYSDGEGALLALLQAMPTFGRANASRGDWKPLNSGASDHYAILRPGEFSVVAEALGGEVIVRWRTLIEIWQRWTDDTPTLLALEALVAAVIEHVERYPTLGGVSLMAQIAGGSELSRRRLEQGGPLWAVQEVYVDWQEERFYTAAE